MQVPSSSVQPVATRWSGALLTALFLIFAVVVFLLVYYAFPADQHYTALLLIGVISLLFALGCYLAESISRDPSYQRSLAWGFFGMGFAVLFLTVGLGPYYISSITTVDQLTGLAILIAVLIITVALIAWRVRAVRAAENREVPRAAWRAENAPSAFSYATANSPSVPQTSQIPTNAPASPPSTPPRSP
jgi:MFS family permease